MASSQFNHLMLKRTRQEFKLSDYQKTRSYYAIPISEHYLFATLADFTTGGLNTSPFNITYNGLSLYIIVGANEPEIVKVDFWGY